MFLEILMGIGCLILGGAALFLILMVLFLAFLLVLWIVTLIPRIIIGLIDEGSFDVNYGFEEMVDDMLNIDIGFIFIF